MIPKEVLDAFSVKGRIIPLSGGQGNSYRVGNYIIKKNDGDNKNYDYIAQILISLSNTKYRVNTPLKTKNNTYVYEGYIALEFEQGTHDFSRLEDTLKISYELRKDLKKYSIDEFQNVNNQWAIAMDVLFRNRQIPYYANKQHISIITQLIDQIENYEGELQIIHADLGGNILFHPTLIPCVIDFSPNIAPPKLQEAIIIADAIAWEGAHESSVNLLRDVESYIPYLRYAVLFRLLSTALHIDVTEKMFHSEYNHYMKVWDLCNALETI